MPLVFWTFLVGALSLAALPFLTAGFYSKDLILYTAWASALGSPWLWAVAWIGAAVTALYTFRLVFLVFFGRARMLPPAPVGWATAVPLVVLAALSVAAGFVQLPRTLGDHPLFTDFLRSVLPPVPVAHPALRTELILQVLSEVASIAGIALAYLLFLRSPATRPAQPSPVARAAAAGWGFDGWYDRLFVRPYHWLAHANRHDVIDTFYLSLAWVGGQLHSALSALETGNVRWYAAGVAIGAVVALAILVLQ